jgi:hypothetical protein
MNSVTHADRVVSLRSVFWSKPATKRLPKTWSDGRSPDVVKGGGVRLRRVRLCRITIGVMDRRWHGSGTQINTPGATVSAV